MKSIFGFAMVTVFLLGCDEHRVFEMNTDFNERYWPVTYQPEFEFEISDSLASYNLYCNVRNSLDYPFANIFVSWYLYDSAGVLLEKNLVRELLFDERTGEPQGESGLGSIYDHSLQLKTNHSFAYRGKYRVAFEQFMRTDTLSGILAVGLRVEKAASD